MVSPVSSLTKESIKLTEEFTVGIKIPEQVSAQVGWVNWGFILSPLALVKFVDCCTWQELASVTVKVCVPGVDMKKVPVPVNAPVPPEAFTVTVAPIPTQGMIPLVITFMVI